MFECFGATKSARHQFGVPSPFSICWRRKWNRLRIFRPRFIGVKLHVIAYPIRREETINAVRPDQFFADDLLQQLLRVGKQFARFLAVFLVVQYGRITSPQFPSVEKWRPVNERNELFQINR